MFVQTPRFITGLALADNPVCYFVPADEVMTGWQRILNSLYSR